MQHRVTKHNRRIDARNGRCDADRLAGGKNTFFKGVARKTHHKLNAQRKAIVPDHPCAFIDDRGIVTASGKG